jgi:hypothetical protein
MLTRRLLLRVVLASVALSAALGVYAIFAQSTLAGQLVGSAFVIVGASALIVPVTPRDPGERLEPIAVLHIAYFVIAAGLVLTGIWNGARTGWLGEAILLWLFIGIPAILLVNGALRSRRRSNPRLTVTEDIAAWGAAGTLCLVMFIGTAAKTLLGDEGVYAFGFILLAAVLVASLAATALRAPARHALAGTPDPLPFERRIAWLGIGLAVLGALISFGAIAADRGLSSSNSIWPVAMLLASFAVPIGIWNYFGLAHANLALLAIRISATATTFIAGACASYAAWLEMGSSGASVDFAVLAALAATIVATASILAGLVALRIARMPTATADPIRQLDWKCPRCKTPASGAPGELRCQRCGLTAIIEFRDDLCPGCGYDLHALRDASANCPECGRERQVPNAALTKA